MMLRIESQLKIRQIKDAWLDKNTEELQLYAECQAKMISS